jgi:hypothetical protein
MHDPGGCRRYLSAGAEAEDAETGSAGACAVTLTCDEQSIFINMTADLEYSQCRKFSFACLVLLTTFFICCSFTSQDDCALTSGRYRIIYTGFSKEITPATIIIRGSSYTRFDDSGHTEKGYVIKIKKCGYVFRDTSNHDTTELGRTIARSYGEQFLSIKKRDRDTFRFIMEFTRSFKVVGPEGMIIKIK